MVPDIFSLRGHLIPSENTYVPLTTTMSLRRTSMFLRRQLCPSEKTYVPSEDLYIPSEGTYVRQRAPLSFREHLYHSKGHSFPLEDIYASQRTPTVYHLTSSLQRGHCDKEGPPRWQVKVHRFLGSMPYPNLELKHRRCSMLLRLRFCLKNRNKKQSGSS
jgi:hypothetical protein